MATPSPARKPRLGDPSQGWGKQGGRDVLSPVLGAATPHCPVPLGCKLWHTRGVPQVPSHQEGLPSPKQGSLDSRLAPGTLLHEAKGLPVSSGGFSLCFDGDKMIRRINCIDPAQFSKDAQVTLRCSLP